MLVPAVGGKAGALLNAGSHERTPGAARYRTDLGRDDLRELGQINRCSSFSIGDSLCPLWGFPTELCRLLVTHAFPFLRQRLRTLLALKGSLRRAQTARP